MSTKISLSEKETCIIERHLLKDAHILIHKKIKRKIECYQHLIHCQLHHFKNFLSFLAPFGINLSQFVEI